MAHDRASDGLQIGEIVAIARRRIWLLIIPTVLCAAAGIAVAYLQTPIYVASTIIELASPVPFTSETRVLVRIPGTVGRLTHSERMEYAAALKNEMTSRSIVNHLNFTMDLSGMIEPSTMDKLLSNPLPGDGANQQEVQFQYIQAALKNAIDVRWVGRNQLQVTLENSDADRARELLGNLAERFIEQRVVQDLETARSSIDFSDVQVKRYEEELTILTEERTRLEKELLSLRLDPAITAEGNRAAITESVENVKSEISGLGERERELLGRWSDDMGVRIPRTDNLTSSTLARLQGQLADNVVRLSDLVTRYEWNDPTILNLRIQQNDLLSRIETENERVVAREHSDYESETHSLLVELLNTRTHLTYLQSESDYLQASLDDILTKYRLIPDYESQLVQMDQEIASVTDLRDRFRRQQESSIITQDVISNLAAGRYRIVEPPKQPLAPVSPNKRKVFFIGLLLGLTIGVGAIVGAQALDQSFNNVEEVNRALDLEVLAVVPNIPDLRNVSKALPGK